MINYYFITNLLYIISDHKNENMLKSSHNLHTYRENTLGNTFCLLKARA